jgi:hypothetical protein
MARFVSQNRLLISAPFLNYGLGVVWSTHKPRSDYTGGYCVVKISFLKIHGFLKVANW